MWVLYTVKNVGPLHLVFSFWWVCHLLHSVTVALRATRIMSRVGVDIPVNHSFQSYQNPVYFKSWHSCSFQSYQHLEDTMLYVNYNSCKRSFSELPKSYQQWELKFLSTIAFRATKVLLTIGVEISVNRSFQSCQSPVNFKSLHSCNSENYLTPGRRYASRQLSELITLDFKAT